MSYELTDRGKMFFGDVFDVYEGQHWIGSLTQAKHPGGWTATTPSGHWAGTLPFENQNQATKWLARQGERIHKRDRDRYEFKGPRL